MEQAQLHFMLSKHFDQFGFSLVQLPAGSQEAAILVAVGITEHDFLRINATVQQTFVKRQREQTLHDRCAIAQILYRLEQRNDIDVQRVVERAQQPGLFEQHSDFEHVGNS